MLIEQMDWGLRDYDISMTATARSEWVCISYFFIPKRIGRVPKYRHQVYLPNEMREPQWKKRRRRMIEW